MKEKYIEYAKKTFKGEALDIVVNNINNFFENANIDKTKYSIGEDVYLKKGTYIHGIPNELENFDWAVENGFIGNEFTNDSVKNKIRHSIGMWSLKKDCYLKDYIEEYSGFTITYSIGRGPGSKEISELKPYHKFDEVTEKINDNDDIWMYWGDQTKEVRFIPSLVANKRQIAFILNMDSEYAKSMAINDVWTLDIEKESLREFLDYRYFDNFFKDKENRNAGTTDRETAIVFGLPSKLIEGVFVGRKLESDTDALNYIKNKLPDCYICNLDGKVIVGNN